MLESCRHQPSLTSEARDDGILLRKLIQSQGRDIQGWPMWKLSSSLFPVPLGCHRHLRIASGYKRKAERKEKQGKQRCEGAATKLRCQWLGQRRHCTVEQMLRKIFSTLLCFSPLPRHAACPSHCRQHPSGAQAHASLPRHTLCVPLSPLPWLFSKTFSLTVFPTALYKKFKYTFLGFFFPQYVLHLPYKLILSNPLENKIDK